MFMKLRFSLILVLMLFLSVGFLSAGGSKEAEEQPEAVSDEVTESVQRGSVHHEAPMLHDMVVAGTLPSLEDRLPENPYIQEIVDEIGYYGGTMRRAWKGPGDKWGPAKLAEEFLVKFAPDGKTIMPNVAESFEVNENGKEYVFHLRKGLKWSDGVPFTAEDVVFNWDHVITKELYKGVQECFFVGDQMCEVTKVDDYTVKVTFPVPSPLFLQNLIFQVREFYTPAHYVKTIIPEFIGEDQADAIAKEAGYADIKSYLKAKLYYFWIQEDVPSLRAWIPVNDNDSQQWIMERNPYFFKVDPEGNQLPYIDKIVHEFVEDNSVISLKAIAGELDMQFRHLDGDKADNYTLLVENQDKGGYRVIRETQPMGSLETFYFNFYSKDPVKREIYRDVRFRQAVSSCLNREEIKEIAYSGFGTARQASLAPGMPYYSEEWEQAYTKYDPDLANKLLDEMGLEWDADHKYRLRPDGKVLEVLLQNDRTYADPIILAAKDMEAIGIKAIVKTLERTYLEELRDSGESDIYVWGYDGVSFLIDHASMIPLTKRNRMAAIAGRWVESKGEEGEPPFGDLMTVIENYKKIQGLTDLAEIDRLAEEIVELSAKNLWAVGMVGLNPTIGVANAKLGNVAEGLNDYDALRNVGALWPWQMFFNP